MASISVRNLDLSFGDVKVLQNLNIDIGEGEFLVLLGSSGCGKSTLLNCIAGLIEITGGQIFISGKNVTWDEPKDRGIGMVFQSYALYPQMTVEGNLAFGLKNARVPRDEIARRIARAAEILHIGPLLKRKPGQLSGGQRQRVAIGRALVRDVDVFLFDEPLSNLDAKLRTELRVEIKRLHRQLANTTMVYVTHDQIEAMTLADRIAVMRGGKVLQLDEPQTIYNKPANRYVADFIGSPAINFLEGAIRPEDPAAFAAEGLSIPLERYEFAEGAASAPGAVTFAIRPEHVAIGEAAAQEPFRAEAEVEVVEPMGADTLVWCKLAGMEFRIRVDGHSWLRTGEKLSIGFDPAKASLFDARSELRL